MTTINQTVRDVAEPYADALQAAWDGYSPIDGEPWLPPIDFTEKEARHIVEYLLDHSSITRKG